MPITLNCPKCHKPFRVRDESVGGRVRCPNCTVVLQVPASLSPASHAGFEMPAGVGSSEHTGSHRPMADDVHAGSSPNKDIMLGGAGSRNMDIQPAKALPAPPSIRTRTNNAPPPAASPPSSVSPPSQLTTPSSIHRPVSKVTSPPTAFQTQRKAKAGPVNQLEAWLQVESGLSLIQWGLYLFVVPFLGIFAHVVWLHLDSTAAQDKPGMLGLADLPFWKEVIILYTMLPLGPAIMLMLLGRIRCVSAPEEAHVSAFAKASCGVMILGVLGLLLAVATYAFRIQDMLALPDSVKPQLGYVGLYLCISCAILSETLFLIYIVQISWPLGRQQLVKSVVGLLAFAILVPTAFLIAHLFFPIYEKFQKSIKTASNPLASNNDNETLLVIIYGALGLLAFGIFFLRYASMVNSTRNAIRRYITG
jgi:predicted Zn finger-like uncharacterized protein